MFGNEPRKSWTALCLLGCSAVLFLVRNEVASTSMKTHSAQAANLLLTAGLLALVWPPRNLNRTLAQVHADIQAGRQARSTPLQRICFLLAGALIAVQIYSAFH